MPGSEGSRRRERRCCSIHVHCPRNCSVQLYFGKMCSQSEVNKYLKQCIINLESALIDTHSHIFIYWWLKAAMQNSGVYF